jgi:hypothetical protein
MPTLGERAEPPDNPALKETKASCSDVIIAIPPLPGRGATRQSQWSAQHTLSPTSGGPRTASAASATSVSGSQRLGEGNLTNMVAQTGRPARLDRPVQGTGQLSAILRDTGIRFAEERADGVAAQRLALAAPSRGSPPATAPDRHPPASSYPHDAKAPHNRRPDARDSPRRSARNRSSCSGVTPRLADHQPPEPQPNL